MTKPFPKPILILIAMQVCLLIGEPAIAKTPGSQVSFSSDGKLVYAHDANGNSIPDFSSCGYEMGTLDIPDIGVRVLVTPADGDDGERIQAALDYVARLPAGEDGFRGAVRLAPGKYQAEGQLLIQASGVVLQGSGASEVGSTLLAIGQDRRPLIKIVGSDDKTNPEVGKPAAITDEYVPVGAKKFNLESSASYKVGDVIEISRPSTTEWIESVGGRREGIGWKPGSRDIRWERTITAVSGNTITVDSPLTTALERKFGGGTVRHFEWPGRIQNVGIEDLQLESTWDRTNPKDEDHAWFGVSLDNVQDAWVRRMSFQHFAGGAVMLGRNTKAITVEDCLAEAPISEIGGYRRHTFFTLGQLALFNRCWSEQGIHDFSVGHCTAGPNAFVQCRAHQALGESGPLESWASGVLYDNVRIDGNDLSLTNRWNSPPGTGWAAANCVLWQCRAANARCFQPPGANNWAIGCWATPAGDGTVESSSDFVRPVSLYQAQLRERLGEKAASRIDPILGKPRAATNPTYAEAEEFVEQSTQPAQGLDDLIRATFKTSTKSKKNELAAGNLKSAIPVEQLPGVSESEKQNGQKQDDQVPHSLALKNGWLVIDGELKTGRRLRPSWWRGTLRPEEAVKFGHNITRFTPGREGIGLTEDLEKVAADLAATSFASYEHHYGLWYDRRRDDHLMVRRADRAVAPPFYEQPFERSGKGAAWDGLSKYDLTKPNPWYWNRLRRLAHLCDEKGMILVHQNYFQHNILEAGAHWADCPWRPANNINETELPEPPPYIGDKRLFMAHHFYDLSNPKLRALHKQYIRQCLENFKDCTNVIQMTSAEYTGPLEFTEFWIDTIVQWQQETGKKIFIALSCTKDVQDAILADPNRGPHVDIIDIRYWTYDQDFKLYAPEGGKHLAPRQHLRQLKPESASFASILKAVVEYREKFPKKAVLYNADVACRSPNEGWAALMGGGSLPSVTLPSELQNLVPHMQPTEGITAGKDQWCLASSDGELLVYTVNKNKELVLTLPADWKGARFRWIDAKSGTVQQDSESELSSQTKLQPQTNVVWISKLRGN